MTDEEYYKKLWEETIDRCGCFTRTIAFVAFVAAVFLLSSCATKTKIEYRDRVVDHYKTKYKEKYIYLDKIQIRTDTCWRDTVNKIIKNISML